MMEGRGKSQFTCLTSSFLLSFPLFLIPSSSSCAISFVTPCFPSCPSFLFISPFLFLLFTPPFFFCLRYSVLFFFFFCLFFFCFIPSLTLPIFLLSPSSSISIPFSFDARLSSPPSPLHYLPPPSSSPVPLPHLSITHTHT